jgi:type I restriction enzyme R subunit
MDKRGLSERDICTKFILPAVKCAGWDEMLQVREEVYFTKGRLKSFSHVPAQDRRFRFPGS